jgi:hypothetical protein
VIETHRFPPACVETDGVSQLNSPRIRQRV